MNQITVPQIARNWAATGRFSGWKDIENTMGIQLDDVGLRSELQRICNETRGVTGDDPSDA
jgi:hypothetical protein